MLNCFGSRRMRAYAALLVTGSVILFIAAVGPYRLGLISCERLNESEQLQVFGGQTQMKGYLCDTPIAGSCHGTDTTCDAGNTYCAEAKMAGAMCADEIQYNDPTRCVLKTTTLCCIDNDPNQPNVICYRLYYCYCAAVGGVWTCNSGEEQPPNYVKQCYVQQCQGS